VGNKPVTAVAVIGMACRLPGGIDSPELLWEALLRGDDLITEVPRDRWDADEYYDPEPGVPGRSVSRWGAFIDDASGFDADFFGIGEREATAIDPQHRLLLETSWEAVEHAGVVPASLAGSQTGVYMGLCHSDYLLLTGEAGALVEPYAFTGCAHGMGSGRIAYALGLHGPAITLDTSCSSALLALHLACQSLNEGESDLALAGGCSLLMEPSGSASASAQGMLSPTGRCRAFDVDADGFVRSEGCAVVVLKRLHDAQRDGDRILAVVRGTAANQDGRSPTITMPSTQAQAAVYRAALAAAGVDADSVGAVEAHGTGTPVGDPIEFRSLAEVYGAGEHPCALGSIKSNVGHTESAAGAVGLIKAVLQLQHSVVPGMVHFTRLPDELAQIDTKLFVPQVPTAWPGSEDAGPRRAAVSSYGMSGTNVHAVLEQAPEPTQRAPSGGAIAEPLLFALSSTSADALRRTSRRLAEWVHDRAKGRDALTPVDLAYTLARRRAHRPVRTAVLASGLPELADRLREVAGGDTPYQAAVGQDDRGPVWVFSGQGSQWAAMGAELLVGEPVFAATVAELDPVIARESGFSVTEAMSAPAVVAGVERVQPTLFAMQVALAATLRSYGVRPGAVVGHSLGEAAAAVVAGALSLEDGARVICRRSRLMARIAGSGAMAAVELPAERVRDELVARGVDDVVVSVVSSPQSTVVGGATQAVRELIAAWEQRGVLAREVAVDVASHSPQVDPILDELADALADLSPMTPEIPYYSATSVDPRERPVCDAFYWMDNLRHRVRFSAAVQAALEDGYRVFAELSPHPVLTHAVEKTAESVDTPVAALAGMRREQPLPHGLRELLVDLYCAGAAVDFSVLYPVGQLVDSPLAAWTHQKLLIAADGRSPQTPGARTINVHPLLGPHVRLPEEPERHAWLAEVGTEALPWLGDHCVHNVAAFPGAAYCEMALAAARTVLGDASEARDVRFEAMLLLDSETPVSAVATVKAPGVAEFVVETPGESGYVRRASAVLHVARDAQDSQEPAPYDMSALLAQHPTRLDGDALRERFDARGIQYGPAFTGLAAAHIADAVRTVVTEITLPASIRSQHSAYAIHPALLDACFQSVGAHAEFQLAGSGGLLLPLGVRRVRVHAPVRNARYCYTRVTKVDAAGFEADLDVLDEHGTVLLVAHGLQIGTGVSEDAGRDRLLNDRLLTIEWQPRELPEPATADAGGWLLIPTASGAGDFEATELAHSLTLHGAQCATLRWSRDADQADLLRAELGAGAVTGVVVLTEARRGDSDEESPTVGLEYVRLLVHIARELPDIAGAAPRFYVVTHGAATVRPDERPNLEQAGLRGLLRVIGAEHPHLRTTQIDIDEHTDAGLLARQLLSGSAEDETAWRGNEWLTARLIPGPLRPEERRSTVVDHERDGMRLNIRTPGDLQTLELVAFDRVAPGPGEIEVAVSASSINFADVLIAFGRYPHLPGMPLPQVGLDFVGVVTAVGAGVTEHQVGDRVGAVAPGACWATFVTTRSNLAVKLPDGLRDEDAAASTGAHLTAWYGLHDLARIKAGDKVLIHSATGGVGQAAIAVARAAGAEIYATAGSAARRALLRDWGIEHVYNSRSLEFADQIRADTNGYGVDIVLNSLTGAAQRAGLELLAFGGRFVEIGKVDVFGNTRLGLLPFHRNLNFFYLDLVMTVLNNTEQMRELLTTVYERVADGALPLPHSTRYPLTEAATALRTIAAAEHVGKLVLEIPRVGRSRVVLPPEHVPVFRSDGSYIVTGGLGGLGLFLAEKMASPNSGAGCGRIVLTSRSRPDQRAQETIELIRSIGSDVVVECGDIADPGTADRLVAAATATGLPLRGVLHAAAVVEDATLANITDELLERDWAPKVYGAWHLHRALQKVEASLSLDWFCSFSSAAALLGSPGQGAYAAANSWLDAFTYWRRAQGLPATAIAWGAWAQVGRATALAESSGAAINPDEGAYAFEAMLRYDRSYSGYTPVTGTPWLTAVAQRSSFAEAFRSTSHKRLDTSKFRAELTTLPPDEWPNRLRSLVAEQVSLILRRSVDPGRALSDYGLDSLGNLELRNRIETETGIRVGSTDITTVRGLAEHLCAALADSEAVPV
jgi:polyketide synthase 5